MSSQVFHLTPVSQGQVGYLATPTAQPHMGALPCQVRSAAITCPAGQAVMTLAEENTAPIHFDTWVRSMGKEHHTRARRGFVCISKAGVKPGFYGNRGGL